jgi:hypothetical protein
MPVQTTENLPRSRRSLPLRRFGAAALVLALIGGCGKKDDIEVYQAPKEPPPVPTVASATPAAAPVQWDVPEGWKEVAGPKERVASFAVSKDEPGTVVAVTRFSAGVPLLANINRWAGQLGMSPVPEADVSKVSHGIETKAGKADVVDLTGPEKDGKPAQRMLAAILEHGGENWYFKLTGSKELVESQKDKFESFVKSVHFTEGQPGSVAQTAQAPTGDLPAGHPPISAEGPPAPGAASAQPSASADNQPADGPIAKWATPAGWVRDPNSTGGFIRRILSFKVPGGAAPADVSVTAMGPSDTLANINRWRGQVELPPVQDVNAANGEPVGVSGEQGHLYDFQGPKNRIVVAMVPHAGQLWFFKMTGPPDLVGSQKDNFKSFVTSVQFAQ